MICSYFTPSSPVTQVQLWLRALAQHDKITPLPAVDGVYSENTANAVRRFQRTHDLPVTGEVDFATWTAIQTAYAPVCACTSAPTPLYVLCPETALGSTGNYLYILQAMLNSLSTHYGNLPLVTCSGEYDTATQDLICAVQSAAGLPDSGGLDRPTWNALAALYNARQGSIPLDWARWT